MPRRATALLALAALLTGCLSVHATGTRPAPPGQGGGVALRVFADDDARRAGEAGPRGMVSELERSRDGSWTPVFRSLNPRWTVLHLRPGRYRVRFPARLDEEGNVVRLDESDRILRVRDGEVTEVQATLKHVSGLWVAAGVATAVVMAVLLHDWLKDHDLPLPPPPPPALLDAIFYVALDFSGPGWYPAGGPRAPTVTSTFPEDGALVAARRTRILFSLSEPLGGRKIESDCAAVLGEESGLLSGSCSYDPQNWWVIWQPDDELPRGDTFHVTLKEDAVEDAGGNELPAPVTFTFKTTG